MAMNCSKCDGQVHPEWVCSSCGDRGTPSQDELLARRQELLSRISAGEVGVPRECNATLGCGYTVGGKGKEERDENHRLQHEIERMREQVSPLNNEALLRLNKRLTDQRDELRELVKGIAAESCYVEGTMTCSCTKVEEAHRCPSCQARALVERTGGV